MKLARIIIVAMFLSSAAVGAAAADRVIPVYGDEALVIPEDSPVRLKKLEDGAMASFSGRIVLTGTFVYGCEECEGPLPPEEDLSLFFVPDPEAAKRLPHWKQHTNDIRIYLHPAGPFLRAFAAERAAIREGRRRGVTGRATIVVDRYATSLDCDSANFSARFVKFVEPPTVQKAEVEGAYGCG